MPNANAAAAATTPAATPADNAQQITPEQQALNDRAILEELGLVDDEPEQADATDAADQAAEADDAAETKDEADDDEQDEAAGDEADDDAEAEGDEQDEAAETDEATDATDAGEAAAAAAAKTKTKTAPAAQAAQDDAQAAAAAPAAIDLEALEKKLDDDSFDIVVDGPEVIKALLADSKQRRAVEQKTAAVQKVEQFWNDWGSQKDNRDIGGDTARKVFDQELAKYAKQGMSGEALQGAATVGWQHRIAIIRAKRLQQSGKGTAAAATPAAAAKKNVTRNGGRFTGNANTRPPAPKAKSIDDRLANNEYGNLAAIV
jgi:hypothetical protein